MLDYSRAQSTESFALIDYAKLPRILSYLYGQLVQVGISTSFPPRFCYEEVTREADTPTVTLGFTGRSKSA